MQKRKPGNLEVLAIGLGCMSMSFGYGPAGDKQEMIPLSCVLRTTQGRRRHQPELMSIIPLRCDPRVVVCWML
jgi:hypothetical protein